MRDYVLTQAQARQAFGRWTMLVHVVKNWQRRRQIQRLLAIDDATLADLGVKRDDLRKLVGLRLRMDWAFEREQMR